MSKILIKYQYGVSWVSLSQSVFYGTLNLESCPAEEGCS